MLTLVCLGLLSVSNQTIQDLIDLAYRCNMVNEAHFRNGDKRCSQALGNPCIVISPYEIQPLLVVISIAVALKLQTLMMGWVTHAPRWNASDCAGRWIVF